VVTDVGFPACGNSAGRAMLQCKARGQRHLLTSCPTLCAMFARDILSGYHLGRLQTSPSHGLNLRQGLILLCQLQRLFPPPLTRGTNILYFVSHSLIFIRVNTHTPKNDIIYFWLSGEFINMRSYTVIFSWKLLTMLKIIT
jgi:hypothetical protein